MVMHLHVIYKIYMKRYEKNPKSAMSLSKGNKCVSKIYVVSREHLVMVHLCVERFHSSTYQKLQAKKTSPFRVLKWLDENAYLLELPSDLHFSPIFNVEDLYIYHDHHNDVSEELDLQLPPTLSPHPEIKYVFDDQLVSTRQSGYQIFLVKWQGKPHSEYTWITTTDFQKLNPELYELYQASNSLESSSFKLGGN